MFPLRSSLRRPPFPNLRLAFAAVSIVLGLLYGGTSPVAAQSSVSSSIPGFTAAPPIGAYLNATLPQQAPGLQGGFRWELRDAFFNLSFADPVRVISAPGNAAEAFVVCRMGEIWRLPYRQNAEHSERVRFLDLRATTWGFGDSGLLGLAFHPEFGRSASPNRGYCYVWYQFSPEAEKPWENRHPSYMRLSRFTVPDGSKVANAASEYVLIQQFDRDNFHQGGDMLFGADGMLYLTIGDEGGDDDELDSAQRINSRFISGVLRIDVDNNPSRSHAIRRQPGSDFVPEGWEGSYSQGYGIPNDNPFVDAAGNNLEEFYCLGLRSPHSLEMDSASGEIFCTDVGEFRREEINRLTKGANFQWPYGEGTIAGPRARPSIVPGVEKPPTYQYERTAGGCIIGGMIYRGGSYGAVLNGKYLFGDRNARELRAWDPATGAVEPLAPILASRIDQGGLAGISEGPEGECLVCVMGCYNWENGKIFKLVRVEASGAPATLSATGAFTNLPNLTPRAGLIPYKPNSPLYSDGAEKQRWLAVPNDGDANTEGEKIRYSADGSFDLPPGGVLIKHFALPTDDANAAVTSAVETRFLVRTAQAWYPLTYRWRADGSDADLITTSSSVPVDVPIRTVAGGLRTQRWTIPSNSDCFRCHNSSAGYVLGLTSRQLAGELLYPTTGRVAHQLHTLNAAGLLAPTLSAAELNSLEASQPITNAQASLDSRARSYLDANCSHCHRPGGGHWEFDLRSSKSLIFQKILGDIITADSFNASAIHARLNRTDAISMPPLGRSVIDTAGLALIKEWINAVPASLPEAARLINLALQPGAVATQSSTAGGYAADRAVDDGFNGRPQADEVSMTEVQFQPWWQLDLGSVRWVEQLHLWNRSDANRELLNGAWIFFSETPFGNASLDTLLTQNAGRAYQINNVDITLDFNLRRAGRYLRIVLPGTGQIALTEVRLMGYLSPPSVPATQPDTATVARGASVGIPVLTNDAAELFISAVEILSPPTLGVVSIDGALNRLKYTPGLASGTLDRFTYRVRSAYGIASPETAVQVSITGTNPNPLPTLAVAGGATNVVGPFTLNIQFSEAVTGLSKYDFALSNAVAEEVVGSGNAYTMRILPQASGEVRVQLPYDKVLNAQAQPNLASNTIVLNAVLSSSTPSTTVVLSAASSTVNSAFTLNLSFNKPVSGLERGDLLLTNAVADTIQGSGANFTLRLTPLGNGTITAQLPFGRVVDASNGQNLASNVLNVSYNEGTTYSSPHTLLTASSDNVNGVFPVQVQFTLPVTGLDQWDFQVTNGRPAGLTGSGRSYVLTVRPLAPGPVTVLLTRGQANDAEGDGNLLSNTLQVESSSGTNTPPQFLLPPAPTTRNGAAASYAFQCWDMDGQAITVTSEGLPPGITLQAATRKFTGTPTVVGTYNVTLAASDGLATNRISFQWQIVPTANGLTGSYYSGTDLRNLVLTRTDPAVNFSWGTSAPATGLPADNFSVRWRGCIVAPRTATYTFYVSANDGCRLTIGGQRIIDSWLTGTFERQASISLTAGVPTPLELDYFEGIGSASCILRWSSSTIAKQIVPSGNLLVNETGITDTLTVETLPAVMPASLASLLESLQEINATQTLLPQGNGSLLFQVELPSAASDDNQVPMVEISEDLKHWAPLGIPLQNQSPSPQGDHWQLQVPAANLGAKNAYFRLRWLK